MTPHRSLDRLMSRPAGSRTNQQPRRRRLSLEALEGRTLLTTFTVTSTDVDGPGTLWQAILDADADTSSNLPDEIDFDIPGSGLQTIALTAELPHITRPVSLDGESQPGYLEGNGSTFGQPVIDLDGSDAGQANGLEIDTTGCLIEGLIINNFAFNGIVIDEMGLGDIPGDNDIQGNFIGTNATGSAPAANGVDGIIVIDSSDNVIGGAEPGEGNLISGNGKNGIAIVDAASTGNVVQGNYIGTDVNGTIAVSNTEDGVAFGQLQQPVVGVGYASNNTVGGTAAGARNIISGNGWNGVHIDSGAGNVVQGNYIGLDVNGTAAVPNIQDGVRIEDGATNLIGGSIAGAGNVISGNVENGVEIVSIAVTEDGYSIPAADQSSTLNIIQGNEIGTDVTGTFTDLDGSSQPGFELGNQQDGILLLNASTDPSVVVHFNVIGNQAQNVISGNQQYGIALQGAGVQGNLVEANEIGTDKAGTDALGNVNAGIILEATAGSTIGPSGNLIGGTLGNLISGNGQPAVAGGTPGEGDGIVIAGGSNSNMVSANSIGTDVTEDVGLRNTGNGVVIDGSNANTIGGSVAGAGNLISGNNLGDGVIIRNGAMNNLVSFNDIGISNSGSKLGNLIGVVITPTATGSDPKGNTIGGTVTNDQDNEINTGNVISGNTFDGVQIDGTGTLLAGNFIGTDRSGTMLLGNGVVGATGGDGVDISSANNTIGGTTAASQNIIGDNAASGIHLEAGVTGTIVTGNSIGLGTDGALVGNHGDGVLIDGASNNTIGGDNVISDNTGAGVHVTGQDASANTIKTNFIGSDDATTAAGNMDGVLIDNGASSNVVEGNTISGNNNNGVNIDGATGNMLLQNNIGTNVLGFAAVPNLADGVSLTNAPGTIIGNGNPNESTGGEPNVISGNSLTGVVVAGAQSTGVVIQGNRIGLTAAPFTVMGSPVGNEGTLGNGLAGVAIVGDADGTGPTGTTVTGNYISGNSVGGIRLSGVTGILITSNVIGGGSTNPNANFGNVDSGILVLNSSQNTIGGTTAGNGNTIEFTATAQDPNEDYGSGNGLVVAGAGSTANDIEGNLVIHNSQEGIVLAEGASANDVGTPEGTPQAGPGVPITGGNIIITNAGDGVEIIDPDTSNNIVLGNLIGIDQNGNPAGNMGDGVNIGNGATDNEIGSVNPGYGNYIAANAVNGIAIGANNRHGSVQQRYRHQPARRVPERVWQHGRRH